MSRNGLSLLLLCASTTAAAQPGTVTTTTTGTATSAANLSLRATKTPTAAASSEDCRVCGTPAILDILETMYVSTSSVVRKKAIHDLGQSGSPLAQDALRAEIDRDDPAAQRRAALEALSVGRRFSVLPDLLEALDDEQLAPSAAVALGAYPIPYVRSRLVEAVADTKHSWDTRTAAAEGLVAHNTHEAHQALTALRGADAELEVRTSSIAGVNRVPCETCREPTLTLAISDLLSAKSTDRADAVAVLGGLQPLQRRLRLLDRAAKDDARSVRDAAVAGVRAVKTDEVLPILSELTGSAYRDVRSSAVRELVRRPAGHVHLDPIVRGNDVDLAVVALAGLSVSSTISPSLLAASSDIAKNTGTPAGVRQVAFRVVCRHRHPDAQSILLAAADSEDRAVKNTAANLLQSYFPAAFAEWDRKQPSAAARNMFIVNSGAFGGVGFGLLGSLRGGGGAGLTLLSVGGGAVLGAGTAYLLTLDSQLTGGQTGIYTTNGIWGLATGFGTSLAIGGQNAAGYTRLLGGALGLAAGVGVGALSMNAAEWSLGDFGLINVSGLEGALGTLGFLMLPAQGGDGVRAAGVTLLGGTLLGVLPATALTRRVNLSGADAGWIASTSAVGGWLGTWAPRMFTKNELTQRTVGGFLLGQALGYATGLYTAHNYDFSSGDIGHMLLGSGLGALVGGGSALFSTVDGQLGAAMVDLGTVAGALALSFAYPDEVDEGLVGVSVPLGAWFGAWTPSLYGDLDRDGLEKEVIGGLLVGVSVSALGSILASNRVDVSTAQKAYTAVGAAAGIGLGAGGTLLIRDSSDQTAFRLMQGVGLASALVGGMAWSRLDIEDGDVAVASFASAYGAVAGLLVPSMLSAEAPSARQRGGGVLFTSALLGATTLSLSEFVNPEPLDVFEVAFYTAAGVGVADGLARLARMSRQPRAALTLGLGTAALATGIAVSGETELEARTNQMSASGAIIGGLLGAGLPYARSGDTSARDVVGGITLGAGLGYTAGLLTGELTEVEAGDVFEGSLFATAGAGVGLGLGFMFETSGVAKAILYESAGLVAGATSFYFADRTSYDALSIGSVSLLSAYGSWSGAWLPYLWSDGVPTAGQRAGGALFGAGLGALGGALLTQGFDLRPQSGADLFEAGVGSVATNMVGAGIGLMASENDDVVVGLMEGVGLLGTVGVSALAPSTDFTAGDTTLGLLVTSQALWNGLGAAYMLDADTRQIAGVVLTAAGLGGFGGAAISQVVDISTTKALLSFTGSVWGTWLGYFGAKLAQQAGVDIDGDGVLGSTLLSSDAGLILTSLALSPVFDLEPARVGWINLGGLGGAVVGSTIGLVAGGVDGANPGNVIGSATGLVAGTVVTAFFDFSPAEPAETKAADASATSETSWAWLPDVTNMSFGSTLLPPVGENPPPAVLAISGQLR